MSTTAQGIFVTGTGTGVGKTFFAAHLTRQLRSIGRKCYAVKPIACGDREDANLLAWANHREISIEQLNPIWLYAPLAPLVAAQLEGHGLRSQDILSITRKLMEMYQPVVMEGVGGWLVPLAEKYLVRDWALDLGIPVVVVANAGLGTLNHTLLTVESIRQTMLPILGIVLNHHDVSENSMVAKTNYDLLKQMTNLPIWKLRNEETEFPVPPEILHYMDSLRKVETT